MSDRLNVIARTACAAALAVCAAGVVPAHAGTIAASEVSYDAALLSSFNLVTLGNLSVSGASGSTITDQGRVIVGGNLSVGSGIYYGACSAASNDTCPGNATRAVDASGKNYGVLTVFGSLTAQSYMGAGYTSGGTAYVGGAASGAIAANGKTAINIAGSTSGLSIDSPTTITTASAYAGTTTTATGTRVVASAATVFPFTSAKLSGEIKGLSAGIAALPGTPGVSAQLIPTGGTTAFITAQDKYDVAGKRYGVITTTVNDLSTFTSGITVNNNGLDATYVIVKGDCPSCLLPTLNSYAGQNKVIFDFVSATSLSFAGAWNGSILAPLATITSMGGVIDGTVIVNSIMQSQSIVSTDLFAGDMTGLIPEPTSMSLFGLGVAAVGLIRRRKRKAG